MGFFGVNVLGTFRTLLLYDMLLLQPNGEGEEGDKTLAPGCDCVLARQSMQNEVHQNVFGLNIFGGPAPTQCS